MGDIGFVNLSRQSRDSMNVNAFNRGLQDLRQTATAINGLSRTGRGGFSPEIAQFAEKIEKTFGSLSGPIRDFTPTFNGGSFTTIDPNSIRAANLLDERLVDLTRTVLGQEIPSTAIDTLQQRNALTNLGTVPDAVVQTNQPTGFFEALGQAFVGIPEERTAFGSFLESIGLLSGNTTPNPTQNITGQSGTTTAVNRGEATPTTQEQPGFFESVVRGIGLTSLADTIFGERPGTQGTIANNTATSTQTAPNQEFVSIGRFDSVAAFLNDPRVAAENIARREAGRPEISLDFNTMQAVDPEAAAGQPNRTGTTQDQPGAIESFVRDTLGWNGLADFFFGERDTHAGQPSSENLSGGIGRDTTLSGPPTPDNLGTQTFGQVTTNAMNIADIVRGIDLANLPDLDVGENTQNNPGGVEGRTTEGVAFGPDNTSLGGMWEEATAAAEQGVAGPNALERATGIGDGLDNQESLFGDPAETTPTDQAANNDTLRGGDGDDNLDGGAGNDTLSGDIGSDNLTGGASTDNLSENNDNLSDNSDTTNNDTSSGESGNTGVDGGAGNDSLSGDIGSDRL